MHGLEIMALTEKQQEKVQVCKKQLDKKNPGCKEENGGTESGRWYEGKILVRNKLKWVNHMER